MRILLCLWRVLHPQILTVFTARMFHFTKIKYAPFFFFLSLMAFILVISIFQQLIMDQTLCSCLQGFHHSSSLSWFLSSAGNSVLTPLAGVLSWWIFWIASDVFSQKNISVQFGCCSPLCSFYLFLISPLFSNRRILSIIYCILLYKHKGCVSIFLCAFCKRWEQNICS